MTNASAILLRTAEPEDVDALYDLDTRCFDERFRFSRTAMRRFALAPGAFTVLAETAPQLLAGFVLMQMSAGHQAYVVTLDVAPEYRRQGLARTLLRRAEKEAASRGATKVKLHCWTGNAAAIHFYEASGYRRLPPKPNFYAVGVDALTYTRSLQPTPG